MKNLTIIFCWLIFLVPALLWSQKDSTRTDIPLPDEAEDLIEDFVQNSNSEDSFEFNDYFAELEYRRKHPLNLNKATRSELESLNILSDIQVNDWLPMAI